jgi:hypothetical protein
MRNSRRTFLRNGAALAACLTGSAQGRNMESGSPIGQQQSDIPRTPASELQVPKMKFGNAEVSRLVLGVNPLLGYAHYNNNFATAMREWYTQDKVCDVMHQCNRFGINAYNYVHLERAPEDLERFQAEGGRMHLIAQVGAGVDPGILVKRFHPLAMHRQGEVVDQAYQKGQLNTVREWCKGVRDLGVLVGVGTHKPEVIAKVEEEGWDVDFYAGCVYNRTRTNAEWQKVLNGELLEMPREIYMKSDPPRMYAVMRQTRRPCFAFKILAAGRIPDREVEQAFRTAFESIKPIDGVFVGMFPRAKDEVRENAEIVSHILRGA